MLRSKEKSALDIQLFLVNASMKIKYFNKKDNTKKVLVSVNSDKHTVHG